MPKVKDCNNTNCLSLASYESFFSAVETGQIEVIDALFFTDAHLAAKNASGFTALHQATLQWNEAMTRWLLLQGADPNLSDGLGWSPLHLATMTGQVNLIKCLLLANANVNQEDKHGQTPLHLAAKAGKIKAAACLLQFEANSLALDNELKTPAEIAMMYNHTAVVDLIYTMDCVKSTAQQSVEYSERIHSFEQQLAEKELSITTLQRILHQQQQEIQILKADRQKKAQEDSLLITQLLQRIKSSEQQYEQLKTLHFDLVQDKTIALSHIDKSLKNAIDDKHERNQSNFNYAVDKFFKDKHHP